MREWIESIDIIIDRLYLNKEWHYYKLDLLYLCGEGNFVKIAREICILGCSRVVPKLFFIWKVFNGKMINKSI